MKYAPKSQANKFVASDQCTIWENNLGSPKISNATSEINGRHPVKGWVVNDECDELAYVVSGTGLLHMPDKTINVQQGDTILLEAGERFAWEGTLKLFLPCVPAWWPEQSHVVEA